MGDEGQPGAPGNTKCGGDIGWDPSAIVGAQPEAHHLPHPVTGIQGGESRQRPRIERMADPVCGDHDGNADADLLRS